MLLKTSTHPGDPIATVVPPPALDLIVDTDLSPVAPLIRGRRCRPSQGAAVHVLAVKTPPAVAWLVGLEARHFGGICYGVMSLDMFFCNRIG